MRENLSLWQKQGRFRRTQNSISKDNESPGNALAADFGMRIDYLFLNAPAVDRLLSCTVDKSPRLAPKPSDHTALVAEFRP